TASTISTTARSDRPLIRYAAPVMAQMDLFGPRPAAAAATGATGDKAEYTKLVDELSEHDRRYYVDAAPTISDVEYDKLLKKLREMEAAHPDWVVAWSPTKRVGHAPISEFPKVECAQAMLSLDNTYGHDDLREFHERVLK